MPKIKTIFAFFFLIFQVMLVQSATYYFSSISGDDNRTQWQAQFESTPWRSISKLNSIMKDIQPGDSILFKCGETFEGVINITVSGAPQKPIVFSHYSKGKKPILNGMRDVEVFESLIKGVYYSEIKELNSSIKVLTINGVPQALGRLPNTGYLPIQNLVENESGKLSRQVGELKDSHIVLRKERWIIDKFKTSECLNLLNKYRSSFVNASNFGLGYFFQQGVQVLDKYGEWTFNDTENKIFVFLGNINPESVSIKVSVLDELILIKNQQNVCISNLSLQGSNSTSVIVENSHNVSIINCDIIVSGVNGITANSAEKFTIEGCLLDYCLNSGIVLDKGCKNGLIRKNKLYRSGFFAGMGRNGTGTYEGISSMGDNSLIELNIVDSTGYNGLYLAGNNSMARANSISNFCFIKDDGGGIYVGDHQRSGPIKIESNIIFNGLGAPVGADNSRQAEGIYVDDKCRKVEIYRNMVSQCFNNGIKIHNAAEINILQNYLKNNLNQIEISEDKNGEGHKIQNIKIDNNFISTSYSQQKLLGIKSLSNAFYKFDLIGNNNIFFSSSKFLPFSISFNNSGNVTARHYTWPEWLEDCPGFYTSIFVMYEAGPVHYRLGGNRIKNSRFEKDISFINSMTGPGKSLWSKHGSIDGGSLKISLFRSSTTNEYPGISIPIGKIKTDKSFLLKFSAFVKKEMVIGCFFRRNQDDYGFLTPITYLKVQPGKIDYEILLHSVSIESNASVGFEFNSNEGIVMLDNIELFEILKIKTGDTTNFLQLTPSWN